MSMAQALIAELRHELAGTRKLVERIPEEHLSFKPHEKSFSLLELAAHTVDLLTWAEVTTDMDVFDLDPETYERWSPSSLQEILDGLDARGEKAVAALERTSDERMLAPWTMKVAGHEVMTLPRIAVFRSFVFNHHYHHRGQLEVYLRLKDVPLPQIYGPTADEPDMAPQT